MGKVPFLYKKKKKKKNEKLCSNFWATVKNSPTDLEESFCVKIFYTGNSEDKVSHLELKIFQNE